jgi:hypothetical protein
VSKGLSMLTLSPDILTCLSAFAPAFSRRVWQHVLVLVAGAILAPGQRMVTSVLRVMDLSHLRSFQRYHRVLNRDVWRSLDLSRILLRLLVTAFVPEGPLVFGIDGTIERRRGTKIKAASIYRDPVRSSHSHLVKVNGLRWLCLMLLVPIPWAARTWALPVLTVLAPSERYNRLYRRQHKTVLDWARQMILLLHRWYPQRRVVVVGDGEYAALEFLAAVRGAATMISRLRLDARLFAPPPPRSPGQTGRPRLVGQRLPTPAQCVATPGTTWTTVTVSRWYGESNRPVQVTSDMALWYHTGKQPVPIRWVLVHDPHGAFPTQALLCTDPDVSPEQIIAWFVLRWQVEVTFHEARQHLGVGTQRHWSDQAIARTTPALFGLFSLVTLLAHQQLARSEWLGRPAAWYTKARPTFIDALALVRRELWAGTTFQTSSSDRDLVQIPRVLMEHLTDTLCYAA